MSHLSLCTDSLHRWFWPRPLCRRLRNATGVFFVFLFFPDQPPLSLVSVLLFSILSNRWDTFGSAQKSYLLLLSSLGFALAVLHGLVHCFGQKLKHLNRFWMDCHETTVQHRSSCVLESSTQNLNLSSAHLSKLDVSALAVRLRGISKW